MITVTINGKAELCEKNQKLSDVITPNHHFDKPCAGKGICGKCRVKAYGALSALSPAETNFLTQKQIAENMRIACLVDVLGDCTVELADETANQIQLNASCQSFTKDPMFKQYGVAIDLGTTTLAAELYDKNGMLAQASSLNPQREFGADVISRIELSLAGKAEELANCVQNGIAKLLQNLSVQSSISLDAIDTIIITGNTAMLYFLTMRNPLSISRAPFLSEHLFDEFIPAKQLNLPCSNATVYLPPCIAAFVGADITTAILASGMLNENATTLLADIGTNGELALWHGGKLTCSSTAAGPAFEGAGISMGMMGKTGAIDAVTLNADDTLSIHVIGESEPLGICGSGVIDLIACLMDTETLDETGKLATEPITIAEPVTFTQQDVRMVQLAKSAICAGMLAVIDFAHLTPTQIDTLAIAGGFGSYVNLKNAAKIGLFPAECLNKAKIIGNAALAGASMLLQNKSFLQTVQNIPSLSQIVELNKSNVFNDEYINCMFFE